MDQELNPRPETIKLLEENIRETLQSIVKAKDFLDKNPETQAIKAKTYK